MSKHGIVKFISDVVGSEIVDGEVVDDANVNHNRARKIEIDGTHAAIGRIVSERCAQQIAHKQRMKDARSTALIQGVGIFAAIRAAFKSLEKPKEEESAGFGMSESSHGESSINHSCSGNGDWGDYGYF